MKEFIYLLTQEGSLFIVESEKPIPVNDDIMDFDKMFFKPWLKKATKYPVADLPNESKFLKQISKDNDWTTDIYSTWFNNKLTAGIRINSENVEIKKIVINQGEINRQNVIHQYSYPTFALLPVYKSVAYYRPSPPLVIGGEETQESMWEDAIDIFDQASQKSYGYGYIINKLKPKFHITRINQ